MKRRAGLLLIAAALPLLLLSLLPLLPTAARPRTGPSLQKVDADLRVQFAKTDGPLSYIVHLAAAADLRRRSLPSSGVNRTAAVVQLLQETAGASQGGLLRQLAALQESGEVTAYDSLWIINAVAVTGSSRALEAIAARPEVARITLDAKRQYVDEPQPIVQPAAGPAVTWGLARIRAPYVWHGLGVDGEGATVAVMDTGVDWTHPALRATYRGLGPDGAVNHHGSWYDAVDGSSDEPFDPNGHGTHVAGTIAGQNGVGVAPGARWFAVRIFRADGSATVSTIHTAFQWLLAPGGDPTLAPDIVNGSWGGAGQSRAFLEDVDALHAAGIITVFAAGNQGPETGSVDAPASYTDTIAVAASDPRDEIAWFSSHGPSLLSQRVKPTLAAPGTSTLSALPGSRYAFLHGTSMAAPHVAGALALLRSAAPGLNRVTATRALTTTAVPLGADHPNFTAGWGRLDAYSAVATVLGDDRLGRLQGAVHRDGRPIPGAVVTVTTSGGVPLTFHTDAQGRYEAPLQPGRYTVTAAAFGHVDGTLPGVGVGPGATTNGNVNLTRQPHGAVVGRVLETGSGRPLTATVTALQTPITTTTAADGSFTLLLPTGVYNLRATHPGHRLARASVTVEHNRQIRRDFSLTPTNRLLLVDSGQWYFSSQADYFSDALVNLGYSYDVWTIHNPFADIPPPDHLQQYDVVIWSDPHYSPGYAGADRSLRLYLAEGGNLLISGQNIGEFDGVGFGHRYWWDYQLDARYLANAAPPFSLTGTTNAAYDGLALTLNGGDSARNQTSPDLAAPKENSLTRPLLQYAGGEPAALQAGWCEDFQIIYLGFGLEGVSTRSSRLDLLQGAIDHFNAAPIPAGLGLYPDDVDDYIRPGQTLTYTVRVRNLSETTTDTITIAPSAGAWPSSVVTPTLTVGPCAEGTSLVTITAPPETPRDTRHRLQVAASSSLQNDPRQSITLRHKTPGRVLLVEDERWYSQAEVYETTLTRADFLYDVWDTTDRGSPPADLLPAYDFIFWYTAYDWFRPLTGEEITALTHYLQGGGRLFLSSQDYLYYHHADPFTGRYLGVLDYQESVTPTVAYAGDNALLGDPPGPFPVAYPFRNWSDGVVPAPGSQVHLWHNRGMPAGVATAGDGWRTIFWAMPLESLSPAGGASAISRIAGWLGDLGDSTFHVDRRVGPATERTYTLTLRNLPHTAHQVAVTNTLPPNLTLVPASLTGGALYDRDTRQITWRGTLPAGEQRRFVYRALIHGPGRTGSNRIDNDVTISYRRHHLRWRQTATTWVGAPDLSPSTLSVSPAAAPAGGVRWQGDVAPGQRVTYTAAIYNDANLFSADAVSATLRLPAPITSLSPTLHSSSGSATVITGGVRWQGDVGPGQRVTMTLAVSFNAKHASRWLPATLVVEDGATAPLVRDALLCLSPATIHMPFIAHER